MSFLSFNQQCQSTKCKQESKVKYYQ